MDRASPRHNLTGDPCPQDGKRAVIVLSQSPALRLVLWPGPECLCHVLTANNGWPRVEVRIEMRPNSTGATFFAQDCQV